MTYPRGIQDVDNISVASRSSRISYEVDPCLIFEELSKQADDYSSDEESKGAENEIGMPPAHFSANCDDGLLNKEINTVSHRIKETMNRVTSDLSLCSFLEEEEVQFDPPPTRPAPRSSILSMFQKRIIDREVKKGKIIRTRSMVELTNSQSAPIRRTGSAFSFKTLLNSCEAIIEETEVPLEVPTEVKCDQTGSIDDKNTPPEDITMKKRRRSADPLLMGSAIIEAALSEGTVQRRRSANLQGKDEEKNQLPSFESVIKGFKEFQVDMNNGQMSQKSPWGMDELSLDSDDMSEAEFF